MDRYNHDMGGDDTDDTDEFPQIGSFGSYSPQYRKNTSSLVQINLPTQSFDESINSSGSASPTPSMINQSANVSQTNPNTTIGKIMSTPQLRKLDVSLFKSKDFESKIQFLTFFFTFVLTGLSFNCHEIAINARYRFHTRHFGRK